MLLAGEMLVPGFHTIACGIPRQTIKDKPRSLPLNYVVDRDRSLGRHDHPHMRADIHSSQITTLSYNCALLNFVAYILQF